MKIEINRREVISTQKELSELIGCPGYEGEVGACLLAKIEPLTDKAWKDPLGNILAVKKGSGSNAERLLLSAHMDEVGFMVNHIEKDGFLRVDTLGRIDRRLLPGSLLQFRSTAGQPVIGVAGTAPPHITTAQEREQIPEIRDLFVDMGAGTEEEILNRGIDVGSVGSFRSPFIELNEHRLLGKAFDDRTACNVIIQVLKILKNSEPRQTILVNFAVQEEFGGAGAIVGTRALEPTHALVIENTIASDVPDTPPRKIITRLGEGPAITLADKSVVVPESVVRRIKLAAESCGIKYQYKKPVYGGTDAGRIQLTGLGVPTGVISVPCRYIHGPAGILDVEDIEATIRLVAAYSLL